MVDSAEQQPKILGLHVEADVFQEKAKLRSAQETLVFCVVLVEYSLLRGLSITKTAASSLEP